MMKDATNNFKFQGLLLLAGFFLAFSAQAGDSFGVSLGLSYSNHSGNGQHDYGPGSYGQFYGGGSYGYGHSAPFPGHGWMGAYCGFPGNGGIYPPGGIPPGIHPPRPFPPMMPGLPGGGYMPPVARAPIMPPMPPRPPVLAPPPPLPQSAPYLRPGPIPGPNCIQCAVGRPIAPMPIPGAPPLVGVPQCGYSAGAYHGSCLQHGHLSAGAAWRRHNGPVIIDARSRNEWEKNDTADIVWGVAAGLSWTASSVQPVAFPRNQPTQVPVWYGAGGRTPSHTARPQH